MAGAQHLSVDFSDGRERSASQRWITGGSRHLGAERSGKDRHRHGRRRTDVTVMGVDGRKLGYEIPLSAIATGSVDTRTHIARTDDLLPCGWSTTRKPSQSIERPGLG